MPSAIPPDLLREIGEALHGPRWRLPLADQLEVAQKTVIRWEAGDFPIPDDAARRLSALLMAHGARVETLRARLERATADATP